MSQTLSTSDIPRLPLTKRDEYRPTEINGRPLIVGDIWIKKGTEEVSKWNGTYWVLQ